MTKTVVMSMVNGDADSLLGAFGVDCQWMNNVLGEMTKALLLKKVTSFGGMLEAMSEVEGFDTFIAVSAMGDFVVKLSSIIKDISADIEKMEKDGGADNGSSS
jgi:hypothetical protein